MNKQEFIEQLRRSLSSINDYTFVNDTISYYENYIESQIRMGKSEEEVMRELGDPRLIAKSIRATHVEEEETDSQGTKREYQDTAYSSKGRHTLLNINGRQINMPSWLLKTLTIIILVVVFYLVFTILRWMAPFICIGIFAYMIYRIITGRGRW